MEEESITDRIRKCQIEINQLKKGIQENLKTTSDKTIEDYRDKAVGIDDMKLKNRGELKGHLAKIYSLSWSSDNRQVVSASQDGKLIVWNALKKLKVHVIPLQSHWVMTCAYSNSGTFVACGGLDYVLSVYNLNSPKISQPIKQLQGHTGYISCCKYLSDRLILTSSGDMTCILWDVETGMALQKFQGHTGDVMSVSVSPDQNTFVSGACDMTTRVWDIRSGKCTHTFTGHGGDINSVSFFPNGQAFGTGSDDSTCRLFDLRAARQLGIFQTDSQEPEGVTSVDFSLSGRFLFAGYDDNKILVWDTLKGEVLQSLQDHEARVSCLGVSPDGMAICSGSWDHSLMVYA